MISLFLILKCSVTYTLYPVVFFFKEFNRLIIPFLTLLTLHISLILKSFLYSSLSFSYYPLIHSPHKLLQKVAYTLSPFNLNFTSTCVENVHSRKVTNNFLLKQIENCKHFDWFLCSKNSSQFPLLWSFSSLNILEHFLSGHFLWTFLTHFF